MTAQQKASELIELFTFNCKECDNAKQSALLAVQEILVVLENNINEYLFYSDVETEILKQIYG
jgi:hypothetical protein